MNYSFLDLAHDVLKQMQKPLTYQEIWEVGQSKGLTAKLETKGEGVSTGQSMTRS